MDLFVDTMPGSSTANRAGRSCPRQYHYGPAVFDTEPSAALRNLEVLYVVGGLYGNELALHEVLRLFDQEHGRKRLVFNGDFHWFDTDPATFERIQRSVLAHTALRGNVETELADPAPTDDAGCGCAYPQWVGDGVVERSNRILTRLRSATTAALRAELAALPMWVRCGSVWCMEMRSLWQGGALRRSICRRRVTASRFGSGFRAPMWMLLRLRTPACPCFSACGVQTHRRTDGYSIMAQRACPTSRVIPQA